MTHSLLEGVVDEDLAAISVELESLREPATASAPAKHRHPRRR